MCRGISLEEGGVLAGYRVLGVREGCNSMKLLTGIVRMMEYLYERGMYVQSGVVGDGLPFCPHSLRGFLLKKKLR